METWQQRIRLLRSGLRMGTSPQSQQRAGAVQSPPPYFRPVVPLPQLTSSQLPAACSWRRLRPNDATLPPLRRVAPAAARLAAAGCAPPQEEPPSARVQLASRWQVAPPSLLQDLPLCRGDVLPSCLAASGSGFRWRHAVAPAVNRQAAHQRQRLLLMPQQGLGTEPAAG